MSAPMGPQRQRRRRLDIDPSPPPFSVSLAVGVAVTKKGFLPFSEPLSLCVEIQTVRYPTMLDAIALIPDVPTLDFECVFP